MLTRLVDLGGGVLRAVFAGILFLRHPRPIHSRGQVLEGEITWLPGAEASGIRWVDDPPLAPVPVVARLSRSVGLPGALPDVIGLAMRVDTGGRPVDIELASTGPGVPGRFLLSVHRSASRAWFGTLFPYRSPRGPVLISARTVSRGTLPVGGDALDAVLARVTWRLRLYHATPTGKWHAFAEVSLRLRPQQDDESLRFDSVRNALPGAGTYGWVRSLRQPSYRFVQGIDDDGRGDRISATGPE